MKWLLSIVVLAAFTSAVDADTVFAVTSDDISSCNALSEFNGKLSDLRSSGATRGEISAAVPDSVSPAVRDDLLNIVFALTPGDTGFVKKVTGALCILERLQPREVN